MHIEFTQADQSHIDRIVTLVNSAYRGETGKKGWTTESDLLDGQRTDSESIADIINKEDSVILIAEDEEADAEAETLVGCVHLEKQGTDLHLGMLTVSPNYQNKKIGKMLLSEAEAFADFWDCTHVAIEVITQRSELIAWYEKRGFVPTGEFKEFPMDNPKFGIPKVSELRFQIMKKKV